ncbi:MAG: glycosyltransferase [Cytophagales bacterium]|nr:glycosyltransferase [Cytophagales bacterium]
MLLTLKGQRRQWIRSPRKHITFDKEESNFLRRATAFSEWVDDILESQYQLRLGHFRDIWGGLPLLERPHIETVFEVNGLPSIELPYRFRHIAKETLYKIQDLEDRCIHESDHLICPSQVIKSHLEKRGVQSEKVTVISNGAEPVKSFKRPRSLPENYVVYFGALQPWQGVDVAIKALQYLRDKPDLKLVICSAHKEKFARPYQKLVRRLGLEDQVIWKHQLSKPKLFQILQHAVCTLAPLTECSRNLEQGCSPLKIFESMACGTPVIASDLPVVREIINDKQARFVRPDRPAELARAVRVLVDYPQHGIELASSAKSQFEKQYTWDKIDQQLSEFYHNLLVADFL